MKERYRGPKTIQALTMTKIAFEIGKVCQWQVASETPVLGNRYENSYTYTFAGFHIFVHDNVALLIYN